MATKEIMIFVAKYGSRFGRNPSVSCREALGEADRRRFDREDDAYDEAVLRSPHEATAQASRPEQPGNGGRAMPSPTTISVDKLSVSMEHLAVRQS